MTQKTNKVKAIDILFIYHILSFLNTQKSPTLTVPKRYASIA